MHEGPYITVDVCNVLSSELSDGKLRVSGFFGVSGLGFRNLGRGALLLGFGHVETSRHASGFRAWALGFEGKPYIPKP